MPFTEEGNWYAFWPSSRGHRAVFLDRDGVLIEERNYIRDPSQVKLIEGVAAALKAFAREGFVLVVITNQSGIGRGLLDWEQFHAVQRELEEQLASDGVALDGVLACPFHPDGFGRFRRENPWRKPGAGMIEFAVRELALDLSKSVLVGDKASDLAAGAAAGIPELVHVRTGHGLQQLAHVERCFPKALREESIASYVLGKGTGVGT